MDYRPKLHEISVSIDQLLLDPANPRIQTEISEEPPEDPTALTVASATYEKMNSKEQSISELTDSIRSNGWQPVDMIFVRKAGDKYLVLEGNRRITAILELFKDERLDPKLRASLDPLTVTEILDDGPEEEVGQKITYLLGVRHHGSLKKWSPFAQAHDMYHRYLRVAGQRDDSFVWQEAPALRVAETLSVSLEEVRERLRVYRVMKQIDHLPSVQEIGGIRGHYFSVCRELLTRPKKSPLRAYIAQDESHFRLADDGLARIDRLCHFSAPKREGAPINNPQEWRAFERILKDDDTDRRAEMVDAVENGKEKPSDVYAERAAELRQPRWDSWLREVVGVLGLVGLAELDPTDSRAMDVCNRLWTLAEKLQEGGKAND